MTPLEDELYKAPQQQPQKHNCRKGQPRTKADAPTESTTSSLDSCKIAVNPVTGCPSSVTSPSPDQAQPLGGSPDIENCQKSHKTVTPKSPEDSITSIASHEDGVPPGARKNPSPWLTYFCVAIWFASAGAVAVGIGCVVTDMCQAADPVTEAPTSPPTPTRTESPSAAPSDPSRIVGGWGVDDKDRFPFFGDWWWGCGTSLIAPDVVLTAAHCRDPKLREPISFLTTTADNANAEYVVKPVQYKVHPDYNPQLGEAFDFMLLKLETPIETITPIRLNTDRKSVV